MNKNQKKVVGYYENLESRLGYTFLTWNTKHFGYYPSKKNNISERKAQNLMNDLLAKSLKIKKNLRILDAGSGRGVVACYLAKKYQVKITGIDLVPFEVKIANKRASEMLLTDKVKFLIQDYSKTNFSDNVFDAVYTMETLVHSPDIKKTLKEFFRILKPKGRLVLFEYSISGKNKFTPEELSVFNLIVQGSAMLSLPQMFDDRIPEYIKKAGFNKVIADEITQNVLPSLYRFHELAKYSYKIIKLFSLRRFFVNTTAGVEFYHLVKKGLVKYRIFTATKSMEERI